MNFMHRDEEVLSLSIYLYTHYFNRKLSYFTFCLIGSFLSSSSMLRLFLCPFAFAFNFCSDQLSSCILKVNYFPSRYDPVRHAESFPIPPAVCSGKREKVSFFPLLCLIFLSPLLKRNCLVFLCVWVWGSCYVFQSNNRTSGIGKLLYDPIELWVKLMGC
jgi:hypothetical protein